MFSKTGARGGAILTRRKALLMPLALAACGDDEGQVFAPLRYGYLPPIPLNVAKIAIEQRFIPSGVKPDVTAEAPVSPMAALTAMAQDRLKPFSTGGKAVFTILDASLSRQQGALNPAMVVFTAVMSVSLKVYGPDGNMGGYMEAWVEHSYSGGTYDVPATLYDITKTMMEDMNVEFEYQIRLHLRRWLASAAAPPVRVEEAPLDAPSSDQPLRLQPGSPAD